jgi:uncharacterized delta-60 repeat protein
MEAVVLLVGNLRRGRCVRRTSAAGVLAAAVIALVLVSAALAGSRGPGDLDRSFGDRGLLSVNRTDDGANAVDIGRKGRIVAAGLHAIARRLPNGHPDRSFGKHGVVRLDSGPYAGDSWVAAGSDSVAVGAKGAVFVAGATCPGLCDFAVSRLTPDGKLDPSFGQGGTARIHYGPDSDAEAIVTQPGGRVLVGGRTCGPNVCRFALARLDRNGELDRSFGDGGRVVGSFGGNGCSFPLGGMALDSRGRIVVGGSCETHIIKLARFKPNGEPDRSFGHAGRAAKHVRIRDVSDLAIDSHDRIDVAGTIRNQPTFMVVRFESGGGFDSSFGRHGLASAEFPGTDSVAPTSVALDSRDRIVVGGYAAGEGFSFARFKPNGHVNHRFGHDGTKSVGRRDGFRGVNSMAIDRRDRIVGAGQQKGSRNRHFGLVRLLG